MGLLLLFLFIIIITLIQASFVLPMPISDTGTVRYRTVPWMTFTLIFINAGLFLVWLAPDLYAPDNTVADVYPYYEKVWTYGFRGIFMRGDGGSIGAFTTFTSMFMHADFWHVTGNMIFLWTFGRRVEDACGPWRYLLFYLAAGMVANLGSELLNPANADIPGIGASGAIAGVMGAYLILFPGAKVQCLWGMGSILRVPYAMLMGKKIWRWTISLPAWIFLVYFAVREAIPSIDTIQYGQEGGGVNNLAHLMGFLGAVVVFLFVRKDLLMRYVSGRRI